MSQNTEYTAFVGDLVKDPHELVNEMTAHTMHLMHMALGIAGEAGEVVDLVKKAAVYNRPLDLDKLCIEMGDLEFYLEGLRLTTGIRREEVLARNMDKLASRYPAGYSDAAAVARRDQATRAIDDPRQIDPDGEAYNEFVWESGGQSSDQENCLHPTLVWGGLAGYVCTVCKAPAAAVQEDIR